MLAIDGLARASRISKADPRAKIVFGAIPLVLCLLLDSFAASAMAVLFMGGVTVIAGGVPALKYMRLLLIPLGFLLLGTVAVIFGRCGGDTNILAGFYVFGDMYGVTARSLLYGLRLILRALGAVSCVYFISLNTPVGDIMAALRSWGAPGLLVSLMELVYRYIFVLLDEARKIRTAQDARLGYTGFMTGVNSLGALIGALFLRAYIRCDKIYNAMRSRGYEGEIKGLSRDYPPTTRIYAGCAMFSLALAAIGLWERGVI